MKHWIAALALAAALVPRTAAAGTVQDSIAQRVLACTGCHGDQGRATSEGYVPRLAGKPAAYLLNQLHNFRDGRREYRLMTGLLEPLSGAFLAEIAAHFAALERPYPPPRPATAPADVMARGRELALRGDAARRLPACGACHGPALAGTLPAVPGLLGLPRDYLNAQLGAWRTGSRRAQAPDCMAEVARRLGPDDVAAVAHWLAAQPVPQGASPAPEAPAIWPLHCGGVPQRQVAPDRNGTPR